MKTGDRCKWSEVPAGALVRDRDGDYAVRLHNGRGLWVRVSKKGLSQIPWRGCGQGYGEWPWQEDGDSRHGEVTVIAVGLRGGEVARELVAYVHGFAVRDQLVLPVGFFHDSKALEELQAWLHGGNAYDQTRDEMATLLELAIKRGATGGNSASWHIRSMLDMARSGKTFEEIRKSMEAGT